MLTPDFKKYFETEESKFVRKALDFFDGHQLSYMIQQLSHPAQGRRNWQEKGMRPMYRNLTNMIVQKSGLLFVDGKPSLNLYPYDEEEPNKIQSETLNQIYDECYFHEFLINLDSVVRLIKTAWVLQQFNPQTNQIIFDILHKGNAHIETDPITRTPTYLVYIIHETDDDRFYREITTNEVIDWRESINQLGISTLEKLNTQPNPYGIIPISVCYDTNIPRSGSYVPAPRDLITLNEAYNMSLTDLEYAASWKVHQTLFTNCTILNETNETVGVAEVFNSLLPRQQVLSQGVVGGLGSIVQIDSQGIEQPFVEYKGPTLDLTSSNELFAQWIKDFGYDWDVRVDVVGEGRANSGFQLVVEEMNNLELRKKRQRMFEMSLERIAATTITIWNTHFPLTFSPNNEIDVEFTDPNLPVDQKQVEDIWQIRLTSQLLTPIDYYEEVLHYSHEDALIKWDEVRTFYSQGVDPTQVAQAIGMETEEDQIELEVDNQVDQIIKE